jgi:hypothetical protein
MVLFALIIISASAFSIQVNELNQNIVQQSEELTSFKADVTARISQLESKVDALPTQESMTTLLSQHLDVTNQIMDYFRSVLIVSFIVFQFLFVGLATGVLLYLKMQGRI